MLRYLSILFFTIISSTHANLSTDDLIFKNVPHSKDYDISLGTGFFIDNSIILTSAHIVNNCLDITISNDDFTQQAILIAADEALDLALLKISISTDVALLSFTKNVRLPQMGDLAYIWSYSTIPIFEQIIIVETDHYSFYFSGNSIAGDSGSPVFDDNMDLIGILIAKIEAFDAQQKLISVTNQAIFIDNIIKFIENSKVQFTNQHIQKYNSRNNKLKENLVKIHCIKYSQITNE